MENEILEKLCEELKINDEDLMKVLIKICKYYKINDKEKIAKKIKDFSVIFA